MTRLRLALLVLSAAITLLVVALVSRALDSAEAERRMRHQAVAHRAFDEMERVLSLWLEGEESRSFGDYRFYVEAGEQAGHERSPLSFSQEAPFVMGAFQIDPDGSLHTPLEPRDLAAASARGDWPPNEDLRARIDRVRSLAAALPEHARRLRVVQEDTPPGVGRRDALRSPGYTSESEGAGLFESEASSMRVPKPAEARIAADARDAAEPAGLASKDAAMEKKEAALPEPEPGEVGSQEQAYSTFQALEQLNFASNKRVERRRQEQEVKVARRSELPSSPRSRPTELYDSSDADDVFSPRSDPEREARPGRSVADAGAADDADVRALGAASAALEADLFARAEPVLADERPDALEEPVGDATPSSETVRIAIDPMTGVVLPTSEPVLALYRSVIVGAQGYRQGLIIDLDALGAMLEADVVQAGGLAGVADVSFSVAGATGQPTTGPGYSFDHRFAEPFDALSVRLDLRPLGGDVDEKRTLLTLAGLVLVLTFGGLFVVDRMTRVVIDFAERRSNFVAAVSHELKTPLTSIRMYAEMLRDGLVSGEQKRGEYLATISDESERLTRLIDNVLEFSRLEKGRADLALVAGDVAGPIREAVRRLTPFAEREGFALRVEVEPGLPPVLFERDALLQVAFNLIDNAIKYAAAAARREIIVRAVRSGEGVEVTVRDFGPGVPQGALRRVFEPFHRGQDELTRSAKGTGIGLALVAELAAAMRARVVGESPDGGGFLVRLTFASR